ncbi:hypothetical protein BKA70DRAFT_1035996, partial [Coprinopsis sp. MPI-PUGE-AT-0042]
DESEDVDEAVQEEIEADDDALVEDDGHAAHNQAVVSSIREKAIAFMRTREEGPVTIPRAQQLAAEQIMPRVSGLARRVHDTSTLKEQFDDLVAQNDQLDGHKTTLDRRVPTRWNSDLNCLQAHFHFRNEVESLTGVSRNKLSAYRLTETQWKIAEDLRDALVIFEEPTRLFSQAEVPLIVDVLPLLYDLRLSLESIRDTGPTNAYPNTAAAHAVVRVAAQAALMVLEKYTLFTEECEIYYFASVFCPDRKIEWLREIGVSAQDRDRITTAITNRWKGDFAPEESEHDEQE